MERASTRHTPRPKGSTDSHVGYWEYLPPEYEERGAPSPLLVFWHGIGENGDGSLDELSRVLAHGPPRLVHEDRWPTARPFVLLSPQHHGPLCPSADDVARFLSYALETYNVDRARVYLTGLSCGAIALWNYLAEHARDTCAAAAVLICGVGFGAWEAQGATLGRVALWAFHGELDPVVPSQATLEPMTNIIDARDPERSRDARCTIYEGVGHDAWTQTYDGSAGYDVYAWLLEQRAAPA